jgi:hypothetical protein
LAQDLVAKKWGIVQEEKTLDDMTLKQYLDMYKKPLNEDSMEAILKLTEVAAEKRKKKNKDKKENRKKKGKIIQAELEKKTKISQTAAEKAAAKEGTPAGV